MVVYTPRDEHEVTVCRSLFWASYNFSLIERSNKYVEWAESSFGVRHHNDIQEPVAVAE
jgi:hypothetical protein